MPQAPASAQPKRTHPKKLNVLGQESGVPSAVPEDALRDALQNGIPWVLIHRPEDAPAFQSLGDDDLFRLRIEGQLTRVPLAPAEARDLWKARGWGSQGHWLLVSAQGEEVGDGPGLPSGAAILAILRDKGLTPRWEERRAFLKDHPDHGEAWSEEVMKSFRLAHLKMGALVAAGKAERGRSHFLGLDLSSTSLDDPDPAAREHQGDQVFGELASALQGMRNVGGWWEDLADICMLFPSSGAGDAPCMREVCGGLARDLESILSRSGPEMGLELRWVALRTVAGRPVRELPETVRMPGEPGPPVMLIAACVSGFNADADWEGALAFLEGLREGGPRTRWTPETWQGACAFRSILAALRIRPLWELGREQEARGALEEFRTWSGEDWASMAKDSFLVGSGLLAEPFYQEALKKEPLPLPPMPAQPAAPRLVLVGNPVWRKDWARLRMADALLPWAPGDIPWTVLPPAEAAALQARAGWGPEGRWVLLRGEEILAGGPQCPTATALAAALETEVPSRLQSLGQFLEEHPGHLEARRVRLRLLKARMPEPRLEPLLAEDARIAFEPPGLGLLPDPMDFGPEAPWKPDAALWQWSAQQVLPKVETLLRSWPSHPGYWKAWLAWARFHPSRPSVFAFASTLATWKPQSQWIGALPPEVHAAVARELRSDRNYPEMIRWLGNAWDGVDKTPAAALPSNSWNYLKKEREKLREAVVAPLAEAYRLTKREGDAREVEATYREMMNRGNGQ